MSRREEKGGKGWGFSQGPARPFLLRFVTLSTLALASCSFSGHTMAGPAGVAQLAGASSPTKGWGSVPGQAHAQAVG